MLGANVFGWTVDEPDAFRLLDRAFDLGLTFLDTADIYSRWKPGNQGGESETIIGKWFASSGKRNQVTLATKVGMDLGDGKKGLSAKYIPQAAEASLKRLQTDRIDVYFSHRDDPDTPLEETLGAYDKLIREGKVRFIGASNYKGDRLREALKISAENGLPAYTVLEPHYNLLERADYEAGLAPVVKEFGLGVVPYFALASGFLTGKYKKPEDAQGKSRSAGVSKYMDERGFKLVEGLQEVAKQLNSNPASVALAWLMAQPGITAPIASATSEPQLESLAEATRLQLDAGSLARLSGLSA
jgi:aryl-alcohol dehydrogenase-like predicted oxidoreductase